MTLFKIYVVTSSPSVPANVQKNLHENNLNMQIFLKQNIVSEEEGTEKVLIGV